MAVMMTPREKWTDERLDDLDKRVDQGFADLKAEMKEGFQRMEARFEAMDARFEKVDAQFEKVDAQFEKVDAQFEKIDAQFEKIGDRFYALNRTLLGGAVVIIATLVGGTLF